MSAKKFGKRPVRKDRRNLLLSNYVTRQLQAGPATCDWSHGIKNWGMMLNDTIGDCTIAAFAHLVEGWSSYRGSPIVIPDTHILAAYSAITGYNPSNPATDTGANETDVLNYTRKIGIGGHKIGTYLTVNLHNTQEIKAATYLFGGLYIGVALPTLIQDENKMNPENTWNVPDDWKTQPDCVPGSLGGHAIPIIGYTAKRLQFISWGAPMFMTWDFWKCYVEEAYVLLAPDWVDGTHEAPDGFNLAQLQIDLKAVTS